MQCRMVATHEPLCWYGYSHTVLFCELLHLYAATFKKYKVQTLRNMLIINQMTGVGHEFPTKPESGFAT